TQHAELPVQLSRSIRPMAGRHGLRIFLRVLGPRDRSVDALPLPQHNADFSVGRPSGLEPHHRHGRPSTTWLTTLWTTLSLRFTRTSETSEAAKSACGT